jgi:hypothetical protein
VEEQDLQKLESEILQAYNKDGMLETLMGSMLLLGGINLAQHGGATLGILPILVILIGRAWRKRITYPRLGYAEILAKRRATQRKEMLRMIGLAVLAVAALTVIAILAARATNEDQDLLTQPHAKLFFGAFISAIIAGVAATQRVRLFYFVAVLLFILIIATDLLQISGGYALASTGAILLVVGVVKLIIFLRANPKLASYAAHD